MEFIIAPTQGAASAIYCELNGGFRSVANAESLYLTNVSFLPDGTLQSRISSSWGTHIEDTTPNRIRRQLGVNEPFRQAKNLRATFSGNAWVDEDGSVLLKATAAWVEHGVVTYEGAVYR